MSTKKFTALLAGAAISALAVSAALAAGASPAAGAYKAPLNTYGQPDLEGTWTNASLTVLERPKEYGNRKAMTDEEVKKVEGDDAKLMADGNKPTDPKVKTTDLPHECGRGFSRPPRLLPILRTGACRRTSPASFRPTCTCARTTARIRRTRRSPNAA